MQMLDEAVGGAARRRAAPTRSGSRYGSTSTSTRTCRPTTSPTSRPRSTCTGGSPAPARSPTWCCCARSSTTASATPPEPLLNLISLQQARIKLGQAGATAVTFRGDRLAVTPVELDSARAKRLRAEIPEAVYESGKSQLSMRVPDDPQRRFPAVVRAADVLLSVTREAPVEETAAVVAVTPGILRHPLTRPSLLSPALVKKYRRSHHGAVRLFVVGVVPRRLRQRRAQQLGRERRRQPDHDAGVQPLDVRRGEEPGGSEPRLAGDRAQRPAEFQRLHRAGPQAGPALAKTADKQLKADCKQLFTSLSSQVMDFLIKGYWYQAQAAKHGIKVTDAQVQKAFDTAKNQQFQTPAQFQQLPLADRSDHRPTSCSGSGSTSSSRSWSPSPTTKPITPAVDPAVLRVATSASSGRRRPATCGSC